LVARAAEATASWQDHDVARTKPAPKPASGVEKMVDSTLTRQHTALYAPGLPVEHPQLFAPSILATAIGDGSGSRLYWELVDKGLTDNACLSHEAQEGAGASVCYVTAAPERAEEVLGRYQEVLQQAQTQGISQEEWRRAQRKMATSLTFRAETPLGRLMSFGTYYQTLGVYMTVNEMVEKLMSTPLE